MIYNYVKIMNNIDMYLIYLLIFNKKNIDYNF